MVEGVTLAEHYRAVERQGIHVPELHPEPVRAPIGRQLWDDYLSLARTRPAGMGIGPISYQEILAWSTLTKTPLEPWEVETIVKLDLKFRLISARPDDA